MRTAIINYSLNKFCPYLLLLFALFWNSNIHPVNAIIVVGCCFFIDKFSFKTGYSVAYCEANNINIDND